MLKKLLALAGTLLLASTNHVDCENMTAEAQLASVTVLVEVYEETVPEIIELRDEIDKQVTAYQCDYSIPEEEPVEEAPEEFFWQLKPLPR